MFFSKPATRNIYHLLSAKKLSILFGLFICCQLNLILAAELPLAKQFQAMQLIQDYQPTSQAPGLTIADLKKFGYEFKAEQSIQEERWETTFRAVQLRHKKLVDLKGLSEVLVTVDVDLILRLCLIKGVALLLRGNKLQNVEDLVPLTSLRALDLSKNCLESFIDSRYSMQWLQYLDLSSNRLTHLSEALGGLSRLNELRLTNNLLTHLPEALGNVTSLEILDISNNYLRKLPFSLCQLKRLRVVNIMQNLFGQNKNKQASSIPMLLYRLTGTCSLEDDPRFARLMAQKEQQKSYAQMGTELLALAKEQAVAYAKGKREKPCFAASDLLLWLKGLLAENKLLIGNPLHVAIPGDYELPPHIIKLITSYLEPVGIFEKHFRNVEFASGLGPALLQAASSDNLNEVRLLLETDVTNEEKGKAFREALKAGHRTVALEIFNAHIDQASLGYALTFSAANGNERDVALFLKHSSDENVLFTAFLEAVHHQHNEIARMLTPLIKRELFDDALKQAILLDDIGSVLKLVDDFSCYVQIAGQVSYQDGLYAHLLIKAIELRSLQCFEMLLLYASVEEKGCALVHAVMMQRLQFIPRLIASRVSTEKYNEALIESIAPQNISAIPLFITQGMSESDKLFAIRLAAERRNEYAIELLLRAQLSLQAKGKALMELASYGCMAGIELLLKETIEEKYKSGALCEAAKFGYPDVLRRLYKTITDAGKAVRLALHIAVNKGNSEVIETLLDLGVPVQDRVLALKGALASGHHETAQVILQRMPDEELSSIDPDELHDIMSKIV